MTGRTLKLGRWKGDPHRAAVRSDASNDRKSRPPCLPAARALPGRVEFDQHGVVLGCQVVEVCVPEHQHVTARRQRGTKKGGEQKRDGDEKAKARCHGQKPTRPNEFEEISDGRA